MAKNATGVVEVMCQVMLHSAHGQLLCKANMPLELRLQFVRPCHTVVASQDLAGPHMRFATF